MIQVDWKENITLESKHGEIFKFNIFHMVLKFSRYSYFELSLSKEQDDVHRCLANGFLFFKGVTKTLLFDNMRTAADLDGKQKKVNIHLRQFAKDFNFEVRLCKFRSGFTKGTNEARNKCLDWIRPYNKEFESLEDLSNIVKTINNKVNLYKCQGTDIAPAILYLKEKEYLLQLPNKNIIDSYLNSKKIKVNNDSLIQYDSNKYSVSSSLIGEYVSLKIFNNKLHIYYNGDLVNVHNITDKPLNYDKKDYVEIMKGRIQEDKLEEAVARNFEIMDKLNSVRKYTITSIDSIEEFNAFISSSKNNMACLNFYTQLNENEKHYFFNSLTPLLCKEENRSQLINYFNKNDYKNNDLNSFIYQLIIYLVKNQEEKVNA
ncbi:MAG: IS21 family transposase [Bacilli bacterium]